VSEGERVLSGAVGGLILGLNVVRRFSQDARVILNEAKRNEGSRFGEQSE